MIMNVLNSFLLNFLFLFACSITCFPQTIRSDSVPRMTLEELPDWILEHVRFPEAAYAYGVAGVECVRLSASWDGKVFIAADLNTLNPAFEEEIKRVVRMAPRCGYAGVLPENIYKTVMIDFYQYVPDGRKGEIRRISQHIPPIYQRPKGGQEAFLTHLYDQFVVPESLTTGYTDTVTVRYTVTAEGGTDGISVVSRSSLIAYELERVIGKVHWDYPAYDANNHPIPVTFQTRFIVEIDDKGMKQPFRNDKDDVYCNTKTVPMDSTLILLNPEKRPVYKSGSNFRRDLNNELALRVRNKIRITGGFVIEPDGTVVHILLPDSLDSRIAGLLKKTIRRTHWQAGMQGDAPVRTYQSIDCVVRPAWVKSEKTGYEIFGKYYLPFVVNPHKYYNGYSRGYIDKAGYKHYNPFDVQGIFNWNVYYQSINEYRKQYGTDIDKASDKYFNTLDRLFKK